MKTKLLRMIAAEDRRRERDEKREERRRQRLRRHQRPGVVSTLATRAEIQDDPDAPPEPR
jgi:hypothetical protein